MPSDVTETSEGVDEAENVRYEETEEDNNVR